jgi:hypothetical protein
MKIGTAKAFERAESAPSTCLAVGDVEMICHERSIALAMV